MVKRPYTETIINLFQIAWHMAMLQVQNTPITKPIKPNKMRKIKFRAWVETREGKEMVYDWCFLNTQDNHFNAVDLTNERPDIGEVYSVMQFTGLLDKNGREIYEHDWCRAEFRTKDGIKVIQGKIILDQFMWCIDCTNSIGEDIFSINRPHNFEVIGDIFNNPELIA